MAPFFHHKKTTAHAEIVLSRKDRVVNFSGNVHHFLSNETVTGSAEFALPPGVAFSSCKITLKGLIKTTTEETEYGTVTKNWRTEKLPFLGVLYEKKAQNGFETQDGTVRVPFKFNLGECEKLAAFTSRLPPSISSKREGQLPTDPQYEITYTITATAFSKRGSIATATTTIYVDPVSPDALSDTSSDGPGEYFWAEKGISRPKSLYPSPPRGPRIELAGQEPPAVTLNADEGLLGDTIEVPFIVKLLPRDGNKLRQDQFPKQCQIKSQLLTKTHMTPDGIKGIQSMIRLDYIKVEGKQITKVQHGHEQSHTVPITRWERSVDDGSIEPFAVARFSFSFRLEGGKLPLPTFYTPILSRRYLIDLTMSFDGSDDTFKLSLPCEIMHAVDESDEFEDIKKVSKISDAVTFIPSKAPPATERRLTAP